MTNTVKYIFFTSLLLNVLLFGLVGGHWLKHQSRPNGGPEHFVEKIVKALPEEKQEEARRQYQGALDDPELSRDVMKQAHQEVIETLNAPEFKPDEYHQKVETMMELRAQKARRMATVTKDIATQLNHEERKNLAKALERKKD